jgi:hypothetical protein
VQALDVDFYVSCSYCLSLLCTAVSCLIRGLSSTTCSIGLRLICSPASRQAFSWYKVYGPHIAQLYASSRVHEEIQSLGHFFKATDSLDLKLNLASANYELTNSIPAVVEYFGPTAAKTWEGMAQHEERLQAILLQFLNSDSRVRVIGDRSANKEVRVPVISFTVDGVGSQALVEAVEARSAFGFRSGHMYSHRLLKEVCGLEDVEDGVVRVSFLHYNSGECLPISYTSTPVLLVPWGVYQHHQPLGKAVYTKIIIVETNRQQRRRCRDWFGYCRRCLHSRVP